jgi:hypothetical protein
MINNTNVENNHVTTGDAKTVYPITFGGATDSGGLPMFKVTLTYADGSSKELVHNVDYKLVYNEVQENNTESLNKPSLIGIKFLLDEYLVAGNKLDIVRVTPFEQQIDFQIGRIDPEQVEKAFDLSVMRDQELRNQIEQTAEDVSGLASDMADVDATLKTKASKEELADAEAALNTKIDSEVSDIESKIPESASATNPLVTEAYLGDNAVKKIGDTMTGALSFDVPGTAGKSKGLIYAKTASGTAALFGAKTDDNGVLRDVAVIPKLQTEALQSSQIYASFIGDSSTPVTRIHAKKIGSGPLRSMLTIPDEAGTIARLEDVQEVDNKLATKQDQLTAGDNIIISNNVISATGAGGGAGFDAIVVQELPEEGQKGVVYLLAKDGTAPDVYDEYVWINATQTFELIGSTKVDLTDYTTKGELAGELAGYLPLSGGTLTGDLSLGEHRLNFRGGVSVVGNGNIGGIWVEYFDNIVSISANTKTITGIQKLNNGEDVIIPTTGGTLARMEDLENIDALPDQTGNAGKLLMTDGESASWQEAPASGTKVIIKRYN